MASSVTSDTARQILPSDSLAWILAFAPIAYGLLDVAFSQSLEDTAATIISSVLYFAVNTGLVLRDSKQLKEAGIEANTWWGILLVPVYLFKRAKNVGRPPTMGWAWAGAMVLSVVIPMVAASTLGVTISTAKVESEIVKGIERQAGISGVTVECPDTVQSKPGMTFTCIARDATEQVFVDVTVQNSAGDIVWQVRS